MRRPPVLILLAFIVSAGVSAKLMAPDARAAGTAPDPGETPLTGARGVEFANPVFTNLVEDSADAWGTGWDPEKSPEEQLPQQQGRIDAIVRHGGHVYIGGMFHRARRADGTYDETARHLVRADAETGELDTSWTPQLSSAGAHGSGRVWDFASFVPGDGIRRLVVVGDFTSVDGNTRNAKHLAIFKLPDTGPPVLDTTFFDLANADFSDRIHAVGLEFNGTTQQVYLGGFFTSVSTPAGTVTRNHLAKLRLVNGTFVLDSQWTPGLQDSSGNVNYGWAAEIIPVPGHDRVLIGGWWKKINNRGPDKEKFLAAVNKSTGAVQPWASPFNNTTAGKIPMNSTDRVSDFPLFDMVLVTEGGVPMLYTAHGAMNLGAKWNAVTGQRIWYWWCNGDVQAVTHLNGKVYFGYHGDYTAPAKGGVKWGRTTVLRRGVFVVSSDGNTLFTYKPVFRGYPTTTEGVQKIWALHGNGHLYVGGDFITVNDLPASKFAIF